MGKHIKDYVKYTVVELENYTNQKKSCVKKINRELHINFPPYGLGSNFKKTLMHIIAERKIGSYDLELKGIILDIKNVKVFEQHGAIRFDDPIIHFNIRADCYVFQPETGAIIRGVVKHISSRQIGVIIYRVFNVTIRLQDCRDLELIELNSEIEFRIKKFDLHNMMPYIEGELVAKEIPLLGSSANHIYLHDSDDSKSSSDEDDENITSNKKLMAKAINDENEEKPNEVFKVPKAPKRKSIPSKIPITEDDDDEIIFSEIFHLNKDEVEKITIGKKRKIIETEPSVNGHKAKKQKKSTPSKITSDTTKLLNKSSESSSDKSSDDDKSKITKKSSKTNNLKNDKKKSMENNVLRKSSDSDATSSNEFTNIAIKSEKTTPVKEIKFEPITPQRPISEYDSASSSGFKSSEKSLNLSQTKKSMIKNEIIEEDEMIEINSTRKKKKKKGDSSVEKKFIEFSDNDIDKSNGIVSDTSSTEKQKKTGKKNSSLKKFKESPIDHMELTSKSKGSTTPNGNTVEAKTKKSPVKFKVKLEF